MRLLLSAFLFLFLHLSESAAQSFGSGSWNIIQLKYNHNKKWSLFGEGQLRSLRFYDHFHYYEYKGGITYQLHPSVKLTLGAGSYQTYKEGGNFETPQNNDEFRVWPQVALYQEISRLQVEQRYRAEMRWTNNGYRSRYRYRIGVLYPFGKNTKGYKPLQINVSNELFFTDHEPYFERNRMLFALNYKTGKQTTIQVGYIHQLDYKINDETGRDFLVAGFYYEISRKAPAKITP